MRFVGHLIVLVWRAFRQTLIFRLVLLLATQPRTLPHAHAILARARARLCKVPGAGFMPNDLINEVVLVCLGVTPLQDSMFQFRLNTIQKVSTDLAENVAALAGDGKRNK